MIWNEVATAPRLDRSVLAAFPGSPTVTQSIVTAWAGAAAKAIDTATTAKAHREIKQPCRFMSMLPCKRKNGTNQK
jgi:hypothetical protein